jgi:multiple sugar transport system permease protein
MSTGKASRLQRLRGRFDETTLLLLACFVPLFVFFATVWAIPIGFALLMSLYEDPTGNAVFVGLENYTSLLTGAEFWEFLWTSIFYAVGSTVLSLVVGLGLALAVNRKIRGRIALRTLMIFPYLLPTLIVVFLWTFILDANVGVVNQTLVEYGIIDEPIAFFSTLTWAMPALIVTSVWKYGSFAFFILLARLQAIDDDLYERARVEGATSWQMFRDITLPNLRSAILIILLVRGIWMFNKFDIIWLSTRGGPVESTTTLPIYVYQLMFNSASFGSATALAGIMFGLLAVVASIYFYVFEPSKEVNV